MKAIIQVLFLITVAGTGYAQVTASNVQADPADNGQQLVDTFFDLYKNKGHEYAVKYAIATNKWIKPIGNEMDNLIVKLERQVRTMGQYLGYEEIVSKKIGSRYRIVSYLVYYQRDPIRFTFSLYKTNDDWRSQTFNMTQKFEKEIEESVKLAGAN